MPRTLEILRRLAGSFWIRVIVSAGLLAAVATQIDFDTVGSRLSGGSWGWFAAAVAVLFVSFVIAAVRWHLFLVAAGVAATRAEALRAYLIGAFLTNFLPSQMGGDVARVFLVGGPGTRVRVATTVVIDRATAIACLVLVAWLALAADPGSVPGALTAALVASTGVLALGCAVAAILVWRPTGLGARLPSRLRRSAGDAGDVTRACLRPPVLWRTVLLGCSVPGPRHPLASGSWRRRSRSLSRSRSLAVTLPPVLIVSAAPISIAGYGVREGSYVLLLRHAGVSTTDATLFSLLAGISFAIASLAGGVVLIRRRSERPAQAEDREQERGEEDLNAGHDPGRGEERDLALAERAGAAREPVDDDHGAADEPDEDEGAADD